MDIMNSEPDHSQQSQSQSQSSSNNSTVSRLSAPDATSKHDSRPVSRNEQARETTPSTSISNASSQEQSAIDHSPTLSPDLGSTSPRSIQNPTSPPTSLKGHIHRPNHAPKRTASGEIKGVGQIQQSSPHTTSPYSHSRHTSTASRSSHISDMSNDLCTRLSYAMFKVQNGFQSHSLDQIEAMALQNTVSPTATPSRRPALYSPTSTFRASESPYSPGKKNSSTYQPQQPDNSLQSPRSQNSGIVRASWQSDPNTGTADNTPTRHPPNRGPTLAPPADIHPRNPRRPHPNGPRLETLTTHRNPITKTPTIPSTPPLKPTSYTLTPNTATTKSAEEQDAVETLMFMSSPGNSAYHPPPPPASLFHTPISPASKIQSRSYQDPRYIGRSVRLGTAAEIDRVLDQMQPMEHSSSDEDEDGGFV
ncbi:MAG: hypothetical protein Q9168_004662 [Polycauliona sp. 1 TL-2023]